VTPTQLLFYVASALALAAALGVVGARRVVHSAVFLLLTLLAVAGLFVLLLAPFLALVQVLLFGGAIVIVLFFAIMLTQRPDASQELDNAQRPLALIASALVLALFAAILVTSAWGPVQPGPVVDLPRLGTSLFTQWAIPFEVASLVLLVALMGALIIARLGEEE